MLTSHTIDLNGVHLHYAEAPAAGPGLVILHGLSGSHAEFLHLVPELAKQAHVYLLDLRGHGQSGRAASGYLIADYAGDVAAFLRQVVRRPAVLLGHSLGGLVATHLAANHPDLLQALLLEDPGFYILQMPRFEQSGFYSYFVDLRNYLHRHRANGGSLAAMVAYGGPRPVDGVHTLLEVAGAEAVRERAIQLHQLDPTVLEPALAGTLLGSERPDDLLARIRCPVHLVAAQSTLGGALTPQDVARAVGQIPHCTFTVVENAGHDIHLDQPAALTRELTQFLTKIVDAAPTGAHG